MPRRTYTYGDHPGWQALNAISTVGAFIMGLGVLVFLWNVIRSLRDGKVAGDNPWDAFTLEWATTSPPRQGKLRVRAPGQKPPAGLGFESSRPGRLEDRENARRSPHVLTAPRNSPPAAFIVSEAMFFLLLIAAFVVFNHATGAHVPRRRLKWAEPPSSRFSCWPAASRLSRAERALRNSQRRQFLNWLCHHAGAWRHLPRQSGSANMRDCFTTASPSAAAYSVPLSSRSPASTGCTFSADWSC